MFEAIALAAVINTNDVVANRPTPSRVNVLINELRVEIDEIHRENDPIINKLLKRD